MVLLYEKTVDESESSGFLRTGFYEILRPRDRHRGRQPGPAARGAARIGVIRKRQI